MKITIDLNHPENKNYTFIGNLVSAGKVTLDGVFVVESWEGDPEAFEDFWKRYARRVEEQNA